MPFFLGIDGGGTKTDCAISNGAQIVGRFSAGTSKIRHVGQQQATASLSAAVSGALAAAKRKPEQISAACIGIAGESLSGVESWLQQTMQGLGIKRVSVVGDHIIAHEAAFHGNSGAIIISGTGSIAFGRNPEGKTVRAGGWGQIISDEGSGGRIGRMAVRACIRAIDCGETASLQKDIWNHWNIQDLNQMIDMANASPPPDFASLFPSVQKLANSGDTRAQEILKTAAHELTDLADALIRRLWSPADMVPICVSGGVFKNSPQVRESFISGMNAAWPNARVDLREIHPIQGAIYLAQRMCTSSNA